MFFGKEHPCKLNSQSLFFIYFDLTYTTFGMTYKHFVSEYLHFRKLFAFEKSALLHPNKTLVNFLSHSKPTSEQIPAQFSKTFVLKYRNNQKHFLWQLRRLNNNCKLYDAEFQRNWSISTTKFINRCRLTVINKRLKAFIFLSKLEKFKINCNTFSRELLAFYLHIRNSYHVRRTISQISNFRYFPLK